MTKETVGKRNARAFFSSYGYVFITVLITLLLTKVLFQISWVPSGSMRDTIAGDSWMVSWRLPFVIADPVPHRGDIVTFWSDELNENLVKRVIGLPGDALHIRGEAVYVNGNLLPEPYVKSSEALIKMSDMDFVVPERCFFALGDNRQESADSRSFANPYIPISRITGRAMFSISDGHVTNLIQCGDAPPK